MKFTECQNSGFYLRMGLIGPSGSGKTYSALRIATELGYEKVGIIDTENRSARRYAKTFSRRFLSLELEHFSPRDYIEAIRTAEQSGIEVLVIDSLSHAWMGRGGVLEMVDQSAKRQARGGAPSSFSGWREVTPEHNRLVEALVHAKMHLIVTMRVKTEYVVEKDDKGKMVPRKVGLAPVQREGLEYEFDIVGDMTPEHDLIVTKSRLPALADLVIGRPGPELAKTLREWLDGAGPVVDEANDAQEKTRPPAKQTWQERVAAAANPLVLVELQDKVAKSPSLTDEQKGRLTFLIFERRIALALTEEAIDNLEIQIEQAKFTEDQHDTLAGLIRKRREALNA